MDLDFWVCGRAHHPIDTHERSGNLPEPRSLPDPESKATLGKPVIEEPKTLSQRLKLPSEIPGARVPDIELPPATAPKSEQEKFLHKYFPPLAELPPIPEAASSPSGAPLSLEELQKIGLTNSPTLRQAIADVEAARGQAVQAGLYPNPTAGFINQGKGPGGGPMTGGFIGQTIKMPGKLKIAQMAALLEVNLSEFRLRQAEVDLQTKVRSGYFDVLVARDNLKIFRAMARLTDEVARVMVLQLKGGEVAAYEPMQVRVLALQARALTVQAHNRYLAAWKQLASAMGTPGMPLTELEGRADMAIPCYKYDEVLAIVLQNHTDVRAASAILEKNETLLRQARLQPYPDTDVQVSIVDDRSPPGPSRAVVWLQAGMPVPVFNRNQGGIHEAEANVARARQEGLRVRADLTARLAQAFERYENSRALVEMTSKQILPSQVQAFRAAVARHAGGGEKAGIGYNDVVVSEQSLVTQVGGYLGNLRDMWTAVVDIAALMQTNDLFQNCEREELPNLSQILPIGEPAWCSPLDDPVLRTADGAWPSALGATKASPAAAR